MKKISIWAGKNPKKTVLIIIILQALLVLSGFILGTTVFDSGIILNKNLVYLVIAISAFGLIFYPLKRDMFKVFNFGKTYKRQRFSNIILAISILFGAILLGNQYQTGTLNIYSPISIANAATYKSHTENSSVSILKINKKSKNKIQKNEYKKYLFGTILKKDVKKNPKEDGGGWLIALTILAAVLLVVVVSALACVSAVSLPTSVATIAAISILALGVAAVVWGTISVIKKIKNRPAKVPVNPDVEENQIPE